MKTNLLKAIALAIVMTTCYNCSVEPMDNSQTVTLENQNFSIIVQETALTTCDNSDPKARISNNGTFACHYQVFNIEGELIQEFENVAPGTTTDWITFPQGQMIFNVMMNSLSDQKVVHLLENCFEISMEIDSNNQLTDAQPQPNGSN